MRTEITFNEYTLHIGDTLHSDVFGDIKVVRTISDHLKLLFVDKEKGHGLDIVIDDKFDMHAHFVYDDLLLGIHVMFEWYDGNDCPTSVHLIDEIKDEKSLINIIENTFPSLIFTSLPDEEE